MDVDAGIPLLHVWGSHGWVKMQVRGPEQPHWDHPWVLSLVFPLNRTEAWAIYLSNFSIWVKWTKLTKSEEWMSWEKNQVMYSQCTAVMRSLYKVDSWPVLCKREISPEETHTERASKSHHVEKKNHTTWAHTCVPNLDSDKPTESKCCSCFQGPGYIDIALAREISLFLCAPSPHSP